MDILVFRQSPGRVGRHAWASSSGPARYPVRVFWLAVIALLAGRFAGDGQATDGQRGGRSGD